jgi:Protein of unknown function (DUF1549)/Protein of unknown function (DUF1553)
MRMVSLRFVVLASLGVAFVSASSDVLAAKPNDPKQVAPAQSAMIDTKIETSWKEFELVPSKPEDDGLWCRRVHLDIIGRIPTHKEFRDFVQDKSPDKRIVLVRKLLNDSKYTEEYASYWGTIWTNILIGRNGGMENNSLINRQGLEKYLRDHFAQNRPYNDMVYELVTATGSTKPGTENFNGATNFLVMKVNDEDGVQATSTVARIFLGLQVQCTQCHNHPFNDEWKQQKFWEMNAFFRQSRGLRRFVAGTRDINHAELIDEDFEGVSRRPDEADTFYQLRNGVTKVAFPVFVDGTTIGRSGYVEKVNRRKELGKLMMQSEYMEQVMVNRMWAHFLGHGFTKPIDDMGRHNPPSHPELLADLAKEFRNSSFDVKQLIEWIVLSKPYQLSSRTTKENAADDPASGEKPKFSHFYVRQMGAEELYQSLITATQADRRGTLEEQERRRSDWLRQFIVAFGTDDGGETTTFNGSIPQSLMMFNGDLMRDAISLDDGSWLQTIAKANGDITNKIHFLFEAGLGRKARQEEVAAAHQLMLAREGKLPEMLQDMWWAILNSNEFIINH